MKTTAAVFLALTICVSAGAEEGTAGLSHLLRSDGKSEAWLQGTAAIREHLAAIDPADASAVRWLPAIERRCSALNRTKDIGPWERETFTKVFETLLSDLRDGRAPLSGYAGKTLNYGYWSDHLGKLTGAKIQIPPGYDPTNEHQLFMYYKLGGGTGWYTPTNKWAGPDVEGATVTPPYRPSAEMSQHTPETFHVWSSIHMQAKGRMGLVHELQELTEAMALDFSVSLDRIFVSGFSDGGFSALWLATHYPHLIAGVAPEVANWQFSNTFHFNLFNVPLLMVDGWGDGGYVQENFARFSALSTMGYDVAGLVSNHGHGTQSYENPTTVRQMMDWAKTKRRNLNPKRVRWATWNLAWNRAYWFTIERMENPSFAAVIEASIEGNTVTVRAKNVGAFTLRLNDMLVDVHAPITVITNGEPSYQGSFRDRIEVELIQRIAGKTYKGHLSHGDITQHANRSVYENALVNWKNFKLASHPWAWVRFTASPNQEADQTAVKMPDWATSDVEVSDQVLKERNLVIFGGPRRNALAAKMADGLPVTFGDGWFEVGGRTYDKPEHWVRFLCPNPLEPSRMCYIFAFNDPAAARRVDDKLPLSLNPWDIREGDCQVFNVEGAANKRNTDYYTFDATWGGPDPTPIGEAVAMFDWDAISQLKANAIKEATGADVALYAAPESWNSWRKTIQPGPITVNEVATTAQLPDFIMTCTLTGEQLKGVIGKKGVFSTAFKNESDAGYDAEVAILRRDIDPERTYTVAAGYRLCDSGRLGLWANLDNKPKPHFYFTTLEEFAAMDGCAIVGKDLRQTELEVAESVVSYIKKRGTIAP